MRNGVRAALVTTLAVGLLLSACRFERRPEPRTGVGADTTVRVTGGPVRDSVRAVVEAFHAALRVGDGSRVATLSVPGATIVDQEEGVEWRRGGSGGRLPGPMSSGGVGLGWNRAGADFVAWDGSALLVERYRATVSGEAIPWTAVETFVLERTPAGWLIRHVHRSRGTPSDGDDFPQPDRSPPETQEERPT